MCASYDRLVLTLSNITLDGRCHIYFSVEINVSIRFYHKDMVYTVHYICCNLRAAMICFDDSYVVVVNVKCNLFQEDTYCLFSRAYFSGQHFVILLVHNFVL